MPDEEKVAQMDSAANQAMEALVELEEREDLKAGVAAVGRWWTEHRLTVGHKRLYRVLVGRWP